MQKTILSEAIEDVLEDLMEQFTISRLDACECFIMALGDDRITEYLRDSAKAYLDSFTSAGGQ